MARWAVIADDLTGCLDTAVGFVRAGSPVRAGILTEWAAGTDLCLGSSHALGLDTESRHLDSEAAGKRVWQALERAHSLGCTHVYKKIDSVIRGPLEAELWAARTVPGADLVVVCPAVPLAGRTTVGGIQHLDGKPLARGDLVTRLGAEVCVSVPLDRVRTGWEAVRQAIMRARARGACFAIVDAETGRDLESVARAILGMPEITLCAGAAGLAAALAAEWLPGMPPHWPVSGGDAGQTLMVSGSFNTATLVQMAALAGSSLAEIVAVPVSVLVAIARTTGEQFPDLKLCEEWIADVLGARRRGRAAVLCAQTHNDSDHSLPPVSEDLSVSVGLGALTAAALDREPFGRLVLNGGETASAVLRFLKPDALELVGLAQPNVPAARLLGGKRPGLEVVTKSGGFGGPDALVRLLGESNE